MFYSNTTRAVFLSRPNRFLAHALLNGTEIICHVKNTGRLKELLIPGTPVIVQYHPDAAAQGRKTEYSLIGIQKTTPGGPVWVNIDSQAPNAAAFEWLSEGTGLPFCPRPVNIRREVRYGQSRFDLAFENGGRTWFMEVKGVTLEALPGTACFPDAPTERGIKHLKELAEAVKNGCEAAVLFVIQMKGCTTFSPNPAQPEFAAALREAKKNGVHVFAYDCIITENTMRLDRPVAVRL